MGECNYYLKARFANPKDAVVEEAHLARLLAEGERACDYWRQACRGYRPPGTPPPPSPDEFWAHFRAAFPLTTTYLAERAGGADYGNRLSGVLGCLADPAGAGRATLRRFGEVLELKLRMIWHFSDLSLLERYLRERCGAVAVGSVSEEDFEWEEGWDDPDDEVRDDFFFDAIEV